RQDGGRILQRRRAAGRCAPRADQGPRSVSAAGLAGARAAPPAAALKSLATVRERCRNIAAAVAAGQSRHFTLQRERLAVAAERTAALTRERYPNLDVPGHRRWRHF